jgi:hypothetical protein
MQYQLDKLASLHMTNDNTTTVNKLILNNLKQSPTSVNTSILYNNNGNVCGAYINVFYTTPGGSAPEYRDAVIPFPRAYAKPPCVIAQVANTNSSYPWTNHITKITTTSFTIRYKRVDNGLSSWGAIFRIFYLPLGG